MSCNYATGLSPYENKGVVGAPEKFETEEKLDEKCSILAELIEKSKYIVVHTGAGISTAAGIPDFRGPNGVWTLEKEGKQPDLNISFNDAKPTKTHMALKHLIDEKRIKFIVSQNIDGLHLRSGIPRENIAELHGNMFLEECSTCETKFVSNSATTTVGRKSLGKDCKRATANGRVCRGKLHDNILDWEDNLPENDLAISEYHSSLADLNICLGTTLQIVPSGNLPTKCKKYGGKLVIVNLQPTKHDKKADLIINYYVDEVIGKLMKKLGLEIPEFTDNLDLTKYENNEVIQWNITASEVKKVKGLYEKLCKDFNRKRKLLTKTLSKLKKIKKEEV